MLTPSSNSTATDDAYIETDYDPDYGLDDTDDDIGDDLADTSVETSKTWKLDFDSGHITSQIDNDEAIGQSAQCALMTSRYSKDMYSDDYGLEYNDLLGMDLPYVMSEIKERIKDCLEQDERIDTVDDFEITETQHGLKVNFVIYTVDNDSVSMEVGVNGV